MVGNARSQVIWADEENVFFSNSRVGPTSFLVLFAIFILRR
jgi:hypothetical protein